MRRKEKVITDTAVLDPAHKALFTLLWISILLPLLPPILHAAPILEVELTGLEEPFYSNALHYLGIANQKTSGDLTVRWIKTLHQSAQKDIEAALQPYGYYHPQVKSTLTEKEGIWHARYNVDLGVPLKIASQDIQWFGEGAANPVFAKSIQDYHEHFSGLLNHAEYESAKSDFMNLALANGYPKARFITHKWKVDLDKNTANLTLHMDTGKLYHFGEVRFQQDFLNPDLLQHYITIKKGAPYSHDALLEFQQNLLASNYASEVTINPLYQEAVDEVLPLEVILVPITPHKLSFGLGYEADLGVRGSARWTDRLINRRGHHSEVFIKLSEPKGLLRGQYSIPILRPLTDRWVSTASYEYETTPDTSSQTMEVETAFVRRNLEDTNFYKAFLLISNEAFTVGNNPRNITKLLTPGGIIRFSNMDQGVFPQNGHYFFTDLRVAAKEVLSDTSLTRLHVKGRYLMGLGENGRLDTRLEIGAAWVEDFSLYPTSLRYFTGGDNSVRGYTYQSLGPKDDEGVAVGGKQAIAASLQYDHRIAYSWLLSGFVDTGNAFNDTLDKVYVGSGVGLRWLAPFGSLRMDIAYPVSEQPKIGDYVIHIGFGAAL
jgi:translocation and assembly module TamA